jgi:hypothetical protein
MPVTVRCAVCGAASAQHVLDLTSTFGPPDLDLGPNGPARVPTENPVVHGVRADILGRAGRHAEAVAALDTASAIDGEDEETQTVTVLAYIRELAEAGDDEPHSVTDAFAAED